VAFDYITVTRQRGAPGAPPYNEIDWSDPDEDDVDGCLLDPGGSVAIDDVSRLPIQTTPTLYAPVDADIKALDRIKVGDDTYDVTGKPRPWGEVGDSLSGLEVKLEEVVG
jgi:hypothetical protein